MGKSIILPNGIEVMQASAQRLFRQLKNKGLVCKELNIDLSTLNRLLKEDTIANKFVYVDFNHKTYKENET